jgi:hypothetical protein
MTDPHNTANQYAQRGWRVVPIVPGEKRPALNQWQHAATTDTATIDRWWSGEHSGCGVGIATGEQSGIWVLDIDDRDALYELEREHGELPPTLTSITGSGGEHQVYLWPADGRTIHNSASGFIQGIDVRGEGGQIVAPPTIHPNGNPYEWDEQCTDIAAAPEWLLALICDKDPEPTTTNPTPSSTATDRPGDLWAQQTDWAQILVADGWKLHHTDNNGERYWVRPGKELNGGIGATTGNTSNDNLHVFTSSVPNLKAEETYTKLGYLAAIHHNHDHAAAARALAAEGFTTPQPDLNILDHLTTTASNADDKDEHGWEPHDLTDVLAGNYNPPTPTLMLRSDGQGLIYPGRIHSIAGEPGGGKTWIGLHLITETINNKQNALLIDYEDTPAATISRLKALGLTNEQIANHLTYIQPNQPLTGKSKINTRAFTQLQQLDIALAVIDSAGESISNEGLKPNEDEHVVQWFNALPRQLSRHNKATVLILDHVAKSTETRGNWAIGSQRKLAAIDGAAYILAVSVAPTRTVQGHLNLICSKDRHGTYQRGRQAAKISIETTTDHTEITITPALAEGESFRPTRLMEQVSRFVETNGGCSQRKICAAVTGKDDNIKKATDILIGDDYIEATGTNERGAKFKHRSLKPYREVDELFPKPPTTTDSDGTESQSNDTNQKRGPSAAQVLPDALGEVQAKVRPECCPAPLRSRGASDALSAHSTHTSEPESDAHTNHTNQEPATQPTYEEF